MAPWGRQNIASAGPRRSLGSANRSPAPPLPWHSTTPRGNRSYAPRSLSPGPQPADELFLQEEEEAREAGALMAVEWPERLGLDLPEAWRLKLRHKDEGRLAQLIPPVPST